MNYGGMAELVVDGKTGALVAAPDADAVSKAVKKCFENEEYYNSLKTNCEAISNNIMNVKEYCDILIQKYKNLTDKR